MPFYAHRNSPTAAQCVKFDDPRLEYQDEDEAKYIKEVISHVETLMKRRFLEHGHCFTATHVKTQGLVKGTLTIEDDLPEHFAQGLFANAGKEHPVAVRYSTETSSRIDDRIPQPRGFAMKIFEVDGQKLRLDIDPRTHDMEFNNAPTIELRDAKTTAEIFNIRVKYDGDQAAIDKALKKRDDYELQVARDKLFNVHVAALTQYSQSAYRHGDYVAKYRIVPADCPVKDFEVEDVRAGESEHVHSEWLATFFDENVAVYALQAQLLTEDLLNELDGKAVEDAGLEWNERKYPFETVAHITIDPQDSFSQPRRVFWEDNIRVDPWHGLATHRPLGSTNRLRRVVYPKASALRRKMNATREIVVDNIDLIPD